ncbi:MAG: MFS transporter [Pseudanabaenaceae cyanobacterium]
MTHLFDPPTEISSPQENGSVFGNANFLFLWTSQVFSQIADKIFLVLVVAIVSNQFQGRSEPISGWVSSIMTAFTIPAILFGTIAGVYIDRWHKRLVMIVSNLMRGVLVLLIPAWLGLMGNSQVSFWGLLAITFLVSTFTQFFTPAEQSAIPLVVDKPQLLSANSVYTTTIMGALVLGFALGEPLLAFANHWLPGIGQEVVVGGSYLLAGLVLFCLQTGETKSHLHWEKFHLFADIREGIRYLTEKRVALAAMLQLVGTFSVIAALTVLAVRLAEVMPEIKSEQFGFLLADASVGMAVGAAIVAKLGRYLKRQTLALIGSVGMAIFLVGLAIFCDRFWIGLGMIGGAGIFAGLCVIPMQTVIQEETPEEMRGKVFGLQNNAVNVALSLPLAVAGVAESYLGLATVIFALSGLIVLIGIGAWILARHA